MTRWQSVRADVWHRDGGVCGICSQTVSFDDMEVDHILGRADGGLDDPANLRAAHRSCNRKRGVQQRKRNGRSPVAPRSEVRLVGRLPNDVHAALVKLADTEARSLNAQIVYMLRHQLRLSGAPGGERA